MAGELQFDWAPIKCVSNALDAFMFAWLKHCHWWWVLSGSPGGNTAWDSLYFILFIVYKLRFTLRLQIYILKFILKLNLNISIGP